MSVRPHTRRTNAFSKKCVNHAAISFHFAHYNFCRRQKTLGTTPAVAAGVTDDVWRLGEIGWLAGAESVPTRRAPHKKRAA